VTELKGREGGPILVPGSRTLVQALLKEGLVDEIHLQVFPVILGSGMRFYPDSPDRMDLELVESRQVPNGVVLQTYRPATA
jgi:dihydrofolate reductase